MRKLNHESQAGHKSAYDACLRIQRMKLNLRDARFWTA